MVKIHIGSLAPAEKDKICRSMLEALEAAIVKELKTSHMLCSQRLDTTMFSLG